MELISKLKYEYDNEHIKTPINFLYNQNYRTENWKKNAPFKVTKESIAKAFFVYDLYVGINTAFEVKKIQLKKLKEEEIDKIETEVKKKSKKVDSKTSILLKNLSADIKNKAKAIKGIKQDAKKAIIKLNKEKNKEIKKIKNDYKFKSQPFNTLSVLMELVQEYYISGYMCKQYLKFMRKYIYNLRYKELVIGTETKP